MHATIESSLRKLKAAFRRKPGSGDHAGEPLPLDTLAPGSPLAADDLGPANAFLPEADALEDRPPAPIATLLVMVIAGLLGASVGWSAWAEIEQVVHARGKVVPVDDVQVVNHDSGGEIVEVSVREGQRVARGDLLMRFDSVGLSHEIAELEERYQTALAEIAVADAALANRAASFPEVLEASRADLIELHNGILDVRMRAHEQALASLDATIERKRSEISSAAVDLAKHDSSLRLLREQFRAVKSLYEKGLYPKLKLVAVQRQIAEMDADVRRAEERIRTAELALAEAESRKRSAIETWRREITEERKSAVQEREYAVRRLQARRAELAEAEVHAPIDGIVQALMVTQAGQSVPAHQPLLRIVPELDRFNVRAQVADNDIGAIRIGQPATVKVSAFDYTRYGTLNASVTRIAPDAEVDDDGKATYTVLLATDSADRTAPVADQSMLSGLSVDVELPIGSRSVLSFLTDRVTDFGQRALRQS